MQGTIHNEMTELSDTSIIDGKSITRIIRVTQVIPVQEDVYYQIYAYITGGICQFVFEDSIEGATSVQKQFQTLLGL